VDWIELEALWLVGPCLADGFVWRKTAQGLQAPGEVVGVEERGEVILELPVSIVVISPDGRVRFIRSA
jgi:hypothetical protein